MSDYTPTDEEVFAALHEAGIDTAPAYRWLATVTSAAVLHYVETKETPVLRIESPQDIKGFIDAKIREAKAAAWDEAYQAGAVDTLNSPAQATENPYREIPTSGDFDAKIRQAKAAAWADGKNSPQWAANPYQEEK